jgi:hypothetical protein
MFHGAAFAALAAAALLTGSGLGVIWVMIRDGLAARRMNRSWP